MLRLHRRNVKFHVNRKISFLSVQSFGKFNVKAVVKKKLVSKRSEKLLMLMLNR